MSEILEHLNNVRRGVMFVIEAPSGTGKTTVIKKLLEEDKKLNWSVSVTTRKPREGEVDGVDYHYVSDAEYDKLLKEDAFYEFVDSQYGCRYGTLRSEVDGFLNVGHDVVFDMDWDGLRQMKSKAPNDVVSIYMLPPSVKELRRRLEGRGTDSRETIEKRMNMLLEKMKHWVEYDYVVICENPEQATAAIQKIIFAERMKRVRQLGLTEFTQHLVDEAKNG
ncbi:MAG: guanylate kinase [Alphaproteobacteria bacterium]|nr:guanylate kinase [Alphaproteobacteria bacterium]